MDELTVEERINHFLKKYKMRNSDLATRLGVSDKHLRDCKKNPDKLRYKEIRDICRIFNISVEKLLEGR